MNISRVVLQSLKLHYIYRGHAVAQLVEARRYKPDGVIGIFH
jgi:hypothetical protein